MKNGIRFPLLTMVLALGIFGGINTVDASSEYPSIYNSYFGTNQSCSLCHTSPPSLNATGTTFSNAGGNTIAGWTAIKPADTTPPTVTISNPAASPYSASSTPLSISGTASDNFTDVFGVTQVSWSNSLGGGGTATGTTSWSGSIPLVSGPNVITVTARDAAGNTANATLTVDYGVQPVVTAPVIGSFTATPGSITSGQSSTLAWTLSGGAPTTLSIDNTVGNVLGLTSKAVTPSTTMTYTLTASNSAGSVTRSVTVTVGVTPPVIGQGGCSFLAAWGTYGMGMGQFAHPNGIAIDNADNVSVADSGNNRIQKFDSNGTFLTKWGTPGRGNGQFNGLDGIAVDDSGNVYVSEYNNNRIQKFDPNGTFITMWGTPGLGNGQFNGPNSVAVDSSGNVYVSDSGNNRIQKFDPNGTFITMWGTPGLGNGQFNGPNSLAVDRSGNVYVSDSGNNRIQKFDRNGTFITMWGTIGSGNGQFNSPRGIAVDNSGSIYVADSGNNRIQKFGPDGTFITKWGTSGSGNGQFNSPAGIAVNSSRDVYVPDAENNRIQVFSPDRFDDTPLDYWATPYIEVIYQAGYTTGYGGTAEFKPDYEVTREQMAVFILRALNDVPADGYCGSTAPFTDVSADRWSCKYIKRLFELGITAGVGPGLFGPGDTVTRDQMAVFMTRALDEVPSDGYCGMEGPFTDVPYSSWSCKYVKRLMELGITSGIEEGLFGPGNPVTRAQMAVFLARAFLGM